MDSEMSRFVMPEFWPLYTIVLLSAVLSCNHNLLECILGLQRHRYLQCYFMGSTTRLSRWIIWQPPSSRAQASYRTHKGWSTSWRRNRYRVRTLDLVFGPQHLIWGLIQNVNRLTGIPPWSGLNHFKSLSSTGEFADGTKFEDLSKVCQNIKVLWMIPGT